MIRSLLFETARVLVRFNHIALHRKRKSLHHGAPMKNLTAFVELESAIPPAMNQISACELAATNTLVP
jgi:hypothetical protein